MFKLDFSNELEKALVFQFSFIPFFFGRSLFVRLIFTWVIVINFSFYSNRSFSQTDRFETTFYHLSENGEIPSTEVYSVFQDSKGNMWFCSDAGATKYDGYYYRTYTEEDGLVSNVVFNVVEDYRGRIWFLTLNPRLCYLENDKIIEFEFNEVIDKASQGNSGLFADLYLDKSDNLFYSLKGAGIIKISSSGAFSQAHETSNSSQITTIENIDLISVRIDKNNKRSPKKGSEQWVYPVYLKESKKLLQIGNCNPSGNFQIHKMARDNLFVLGNQLFNKNGLVEGIDEVLNASYAPNEHNVVWVGTKSGLFKGRIKNSRFVIEETFLDDLVVTGICWDKEGSGWFSTLNAGVFYCSNFDVVKLTNQSLNMDRVISSVIESKEHLYYSSKKYCYELGGEKKFELKNSSYSKLGDWNGNLIMSAASWDFEFSDGIIKAPYLRDFKVRNNSVYGVSSRVLKFDPITSQVDTLYDATRDSSYLRKLFFRTIEVLHDGKTIIGGPTGISLIDSGELVNNYLNSETLGLDVSDLLFDRRWGLIVATCNKGVIIFRGNESPIRLNRSNGLISNNISCLSVCDDGMLLIGTNYGLNYIAVNSGGIGLVSRNLGLESHDINSIYTNHQYAYIGTKGGLFRINRDLFRSKKSKVGTKAYLDDLFVNGTKQTVKDNQFTLGSGFNVVRIRFRVNNYKNWFNKKYQYRLNGDEDWINISSPEIVLYRPSEKLNVEVRYSNENNHWSQPFFLIGVDVKLPIWERWYFWLACMVFIIIAVAYLLQRRQRIHERELELKNEMLSLEQRMHSARMNPHFIFNVLNSIQGFMMFHENERAEKYLVKFSTLMRKVLDNSSDGQIFLNEEIEIIEKFLELEQLRSNEAFSYKILIPREIENCLIPTMLIQPFIENAILHGVNNQRKSGEIVVNFSKAGERALRVTVFNNAEISEDQMRKINNSTNMNALGLTKSRLQNYCQLTGDIRYKVSVERSFNNVTGTALIVVIPILKRKDESINRG